jgi:hypothetical protein
VRRSAFDGLLLIALILLIQLSNSAFRLHDKERLVTKGSAEAIDAWEKI